MQSKIKLIILLIIYIFVSGGCRKTVTQLSPDATPAQLASNAKPAQNVKVQLFDAKEHLRTAKPAKITVQVKDYATGEPIYFRTRIRDSIGRFTDSLIDRYGFAAYAKTTKTVTTGYAEVLIDGGRRRIGTQKVVEIKSRGSKKVKFKMGMPSELDFKTKGWISADLYRPLNGRRRINIAANQKMAGLVASANTLELLALAMPWGKTAPKEGRYNNLPDASYITRAYRSNSAPFYGDIIFMGTEFPLLAAPAPFDANWANFRVIEEIRKQNGLSIYNMPTEEKLLDPKNDILLIHPKLASFYKNITSAIDGLPAELPFDLIAGVYPDAIGITPSEKSFELWFALLNAGYRIPTVLIKTQSVDEGVMPEERVFIRRELKNINTPLHPREVISAIKAGRIMNTDGPFAFLSIDGKEIGSTLKADGKEHQLEFEVYATTKRAAKIISVEIIRNGEIIETIKGQNRKFIAGSLTIKESESSWYILRVYSKYKEGAVCWTAPIYFSNANYKKRAAIKTTVTGRVVDIKTAMPIPAIIEAHLNGKLQASTESQKETGRYKLKCSPAATITVKAKGYKQESKCVFYATDAIYEILNIHKNASGKGARALVEQETYNKLRAATQEARLNFRINPIP